MFDFEMPSAGSEATSLLSVSGGGLLGVIPAAMLVRFEDLGQAKYGTQYRLCDSFDGVAGSSTGAVIATGVALGLSAQEIADFYLQDVPQGFKRRRFAIPLLQDVFDGNLLQSFFEERTEGRVLDRSHLQCDLTVMVKDMDRAKSIAFTTLDYTQPSLFGVELRREALPLAELLRASTAAPGLFSPVSLDLNGVGTTRLIDGGFSLFNDPSFLTSRLAQQTSRDHIVLTSLGTGSSRPTYRSLSGKPVPSILRAFRGLFGLIKDGENLVKTLMQDLSDQSGAAIQYRHHDMSLTTETFADLGFDLRPGELRAMRKFADFKGKERLFDAACTYAEQTITCALPLARRQKQTQLIDSTA